MNKSNFSIRESDGAGNHIGTIIAESNEDLATKIAVACSGHFDVEVDVPEKIVMGFYINNEPQDIILTSKAVKDFNQTISICQTWIY